MIGLNTENFCQHEINAGYTDPAGKEAAMKGYEKFASKKENNADILTPKQMFHKLLFKYHSDMAGGDDEATKDLIDLFKSKSYEKIIELYNLEIEKEKVKEKRLDLAA